MFSSRPVTSTQPHLSEGMLRVLVYSMPKSSCRFLHSFRRPLIPGAAAFQVLAKEKTYIESFDLTTFHDGQVLPYSSPNFWKGFSSCFSSTGSRPETHATQQIGIACVAAERV